MSCLTQFAKYVIFLFNFVIATCAIVLIVFGVMFIVNEKNGVNVFGEYFSLGALAVSVGGIIFVIAAIGCCGAIHENSCLLTTYASILIALFVIQVVLGVLAVVKIDDADDFFIHVKNLIQDLFNKNDKNSVEAFHNLQTQFKCCGVSGPADYNNPASYPSSCCENDNAPCVNPFKEGCASAFTDTMKGYIEIIGYVAIGFAVVELAGAIFAFIVRKRQSEYV